MPAKLHSTTSVCLEQSCHLFVPWVGLISKMEVHYVEVAYVELKHNIHIPIEWPIQEIEGLVLGLVEKIIKDPGPSTYILEANNVPAKLIRRKTENGCLYVFQKVSHEELGSSHLYEVILPLDDHSIRIEISSGENQASRPWRVYCATTSPKEEMPLCIEEKFGSAQAKLKLRHCILRNIERLSPNQVNILIILIGTFWFVCIIIISLNLHMWR